jgi:hypothetical protein
LAAIVEVKKVGHANPEWAAAWFCNYMDYSGDTAPRFVLLATPENLYVWKTSSAESAASTDARTLLASYRRRSKRDLADIASFSFELIVGAWLDDLLHHIWNPSTPPEVHAFVDSGLLEAIEGGKVVATARA